MKHFLAVALLGLGLNFGGMSHTEAAPMSPAMSYTPSGDSAMTPARGWWAVPFVVGGAVLFHHRYHHHHRCYRRCWRHHGHRHCRRYC